MLFGVFGMTVLIPVVTILPHSQAFDTEVPCTWSLTSLQREKTVGSSQVILLATLSNHIFHSKNRNISTFVKILRVWPDLSVYHLIITHSADCLNIRIIWTYHSLTYTAHQTVPFWLYSVCWWICFVFPLLEIWLSARSRISRGVRHIHRKSDPT